MNMKMTLTLFPSDISFISGPLLTWHKENRGPDPKDIAALDKRSVLAKVSSQGSGR